MNTNLYRTVFHWSGGKDSMLALHRLVKHEDYRIERLLTNFSATTRRVSMHGVRSELLEAQAVSIGFPLDKMYYEALDYDQQLASVFKEFEQEGITHIGYGDIFLEDLKKYRDDQLENAKLYGTYPIWKEDSLTLVEEFMDLGYKAVIVCVNGSVLDKSFVGRIIDREFIADLPSQVDPCGENGEFHSFVFDGPMFEKPIQYKQGSVVGKTYPNPAGANEIQFWFGDLIVE